MYIMVSQELRVNQRNEQSQALVEISLNNIGTLGIILYSQWFTCKAICLDRII